MPKTNLKESDHLQLNVLRNAAYSTREKLVEQILAARGVIADQREDIRTMEGHIREMHREYVFAYTALGLNRQQEYQRYCTFHGKCRLCGSPADEKGGMCVVHRGRAKEKAKEKKLVKQ